jgi:hypothetical protein
MPRTARAADPVHVVRDRARQIEVDDDRELVEFMSRNMAEREPFYGQAALTIDGGAMSDDEILEFITEKLKERNG